MRERPPPPTMPLDATADGTLPPSRAHESTVIHEDASEAASAPDVALDPQWKERHDRYADVGPIGRGGMGEVRRVRDVALGRVLAMKILPWQMIDAPRSRARFLDEVRTTAALQHPGIIPVHDAGELPDGRLWFTMKEVRGATLRDVIEALHAGEERWSLRRVIEAFARACEAMAYAHSRGVIHRDLKPENIMTGEFGEVLVMDWGLVKYVGSPRMDYEESATSPPPSFSDSPGDSRTRHGDVVGTPAYMSPEQARGDIDHLGPATDVYSLGAVLYEILCGRPPYVGSPRGVWTAVLDGPPDPVDVHANPRVPIPAELASLCARAMARSPSDRFADAGALGAEVRAFLDDAKKRDRALALVEDARKLAPRLDRLRARAEEAERDAREILDKLKPFAPASQKARGWALEDEASALRREASMEEVRWIQTLTSALTELPDLPEAHAMLADHYRDRLLAAEEARDKDAAVRAEALLRLHDRGRHAAFVSGRAAVSLVTDPPGAEVSLYRYIESERVLILDYEGELGRTPILEAPLTKGSYLLKVRAPGFVEMAYPVQVGRGEHWTGVAPGDSAPRPVRLLREGEIDPDERQVPAGLFIAGGDPDAADSLPRTRLWAEDFVVRRFPVTNLEYLLFLNSLVTAGRLEEALAACPRPTLGTATPEKDEPLFPRGSDGLFDLAPSPVPRAVELAWPVAFVDWHGAMKYAAWESAATNRPYRLLNELEWEKAARGVDGRLAPWGDHIDPTFACMLASHEGKPSRVPVTDYPVDESPYGVRGMAGNVRDWCINEWRPEGPRVVNGVVQIDAASPESDGLRSSRGGAWSAAPVFCRAAARFAGAPDRRFGIAGFRLARGLRRLEGE